MKKLPKRLLSLTLILVMAFTLLPANAPAVYATVGDTVPGVPPSDGEDIEGIAIPSLDDWLADTFPDEGDGETDDVGDDDLPEEGDTSDVGEGLAPPADPDDETSLAEDDTSPVGEGLAPPADLDDEAYSSEAEPSDIADENAPSLPAPDTTKFLAEIEPIPDTAGWTAISDRAGLEAIANDLSGKYYLTADIDLSDSNWTPLGNGYSQAFTGVFDGQGYVIGGLTLSGNMEYAGLFGYVSDATIKNVGLEHTNIDIGSYDDNACTGGVCGYVVSTTYADEETTISNCYNTGKISVFSGSSSSFAYVGGICGSASSDGGIINIRHYYNSGEVSASFVKSSENKNTGYAYAGGVCGRADPATISHCYNEGNVSASFVSISDSISSGNAYAGGVCGYASSNITTVNGCYNTGKVNASSSSPYAGGVCGYAISNTISDCYNTGEVNASSDGSGAYAGGVCGRTDKAIIGSCYNTGKVNASSDKSGSAYAGGVCGYDSSANSPTTINNCYNAGEVSAASGNYAYAGGVCGEGYLSITNCYNMGAVSASSGSVYPSGPAHAGGIFGRGYYSTIANCYNTGNVNASSGKSGSAYVGGICGYFMASYGTTPSPASCYWNSDSRQTANGRSLSPKKGVGAFYAEDGADTTKPLTTAQMKQQASFAGFDFTNVWEISASANNGYPSLRGLPAFTGGQPGLQKSVAVGAPSGALTADEAGTVTYPVTTKDIKNGNYTATVAGRPAGVTVRGQVAINNNAGTLTLAGDGSTPADTYSGLALTLDGTTSAGFTLTVNPSPIEPVAVTGVSLRPTALALETGAKAQLLATVAPLSAADRRLEWASDNPDAVTVAGNGFAATITAIAPGEATVTATNAASGLSASCTVTVTDPVFYAESLGLAPSYALVAQETGGSATFIHGLDTGKYAIEWEYLSPGSSAWSETAPAAFTTGFVDESDNDLKGIQITVAENAPTGTYRVRATTPGSKTATLSAIATIEVRAAASATADARLLDTSVTANPALADGYGAAVPFQVTGAEAAFLAALSAGPGQEGVVKLYTDWNGEGGNLLTRQVNGIEAVLRDARTIEIITGRNGADLWTSTSKFSNVTVVIGGVPLAGLLNINLKTAYPKFTFTTAKALNAFYPGSTAKVLATTDTGARVRSVSLEPVGNAANSLAASGDSLTVLPGAKAASHRFTATVTVEGYKAVAAAGTVTATISVINDRPKLKLSASTITLGEGGPYNYGDASFQILSSDAAKPLGDYWGGLDADTGMGKGKTKVFRGGEDVSGLFAIASDGKVTIARENQTKDKIPAGKYQIRAVINSDSGGSAPINLNFTLKWAAYNDTNKKPTFKLSPASITVNADPARRSNLTWVAVVPSAANLNYRDWAVAKGELPGGFSVLGGSARNTIRLRTKNETLTAGKKTVEINSAAGLFKSNAKLTINVSGSPASFTMTQKGKLDLLNPASTVAVTAKFKNTAPRIKEVELYEDKDFTKESGLFEVVRAKNGEPLLAGNTFYVKASGSLPDGRARQNLYVKLLFADTASEPELKAGKALVVAPVQSAAKARASRGSLTLYSGQPDASEELALTLTSSVNAPLGAARLAPASADMGFDLARTGRDTWALGFKDGVIPEPGSYTLTLELWPEGTFEVDGNGSIKAYGSGSTATKPATVKVKVVVK